jgi:LysR family glycine cleavage system transcriptional activator
MGRWRERHPEIALEVDASQQLVDLQRDGFHAGVRTGMGRWAGLESEPLIDSPLIAVGSPATARRLFGQGEAALADEPLIGDVPMWQQWFAAVGVKTRVRPVAEFNDAGLMLQAAEHGLGITLGRELLVADALADGRLVRLSPASVQVEGTRGYFLVYPPALRDWPPLEALRRWMHDELERAQRELRSLRLVAPVRASARPVQQGGTERGAPAKRRTPHAAATKRSRR